MPPSALPIIVIIMGAGSVISGLAIYKPVQLSWLVWLCGGYHFARIIHFVLTILFVLFFVVHIVQVILAGWNNFRSAIAGFEVKRIAADEQKNTGKTSTEKNLHQQKEPMHRRTVLSFGVFTGLSAATYGAWHWLYKAAPETRGVTGRAREPLRRALNQTELAFRKTFSHDHLVKTYPVSMAAKNVRINSLIGMKQPPQPDWKLHVKKASGQVLSLALGEIRQLPKTEIIFDFKCVEGWDQISHWGGVKFADFISHFQLDKEALLNYVGIKTPDGGYYVGIDTPSALHPQTLLAYEMNDKPLEIAHGAPLRLIIPVKYGIKNLKRIGMIEFSNKRLPDYWAERGYDYYSGL